MRKAKVVLIVALTALIAQAAVIADAFLGVIIMDQEGHVSNLTFFEH